jgi:hypothetical protein
MWRRSERKKSVANMTFLAVNIIAIQTKLTTDKYAQRYPTPQHALNRTANIHSELETFPNKKMDHIVLQLVT